MGTVLHHLMVELPGCGQSAFPMPPLAIRKLPSSHADLLGFLHALVAGLFAEQSELDVHLN
jgi:hypothetical protein